LATTPESNLKELIDRGTIVKRNFKATGGVGMPTFNTISGSEFEEWLADIKASVSQLKSDSLTQNVLKLADSFDGWSDEKIFDKLTAELKAIYKNYNNYILKKDVYMGDDNMIKSKVFVVHGRNGKIRSSMFSFLRSIGVEPLEWNEVKKLTKKASPYIGEILDVAFKNAQAIVVLFTPDDEAKLKDEFINIDDPDDEKVLTPQARPNVIFEAGMALGRMEDRTIIIQFGKLRNFSDISGRHIIRFLDNPEKRYELVEHLKNAGVDVNIDGRTEWLSVGDFKI
jgi:predicted nucleotide-binding protein